MELNDDLNLNEISILALRPTTRQIITNELDKRKVLASEEGFPRDWRGLAHLTGLPEPAGNRPTDDLLTAWIRQPDASLGKLEEFLRRMDRWDIIDDIHHLMRDDARFYIANISRNNAEPQPNEVDMADQVLTYDDIHRLEEGLELKQYDALLLYADEDKCFAEQMLDRLENDYSLQVCLRENLIGGLAFEYQGILQLITDRCHCVIIILSSSFLTSPVNRFFVSFAQALSIENRRRIIIPCMYERIDMELPQEIRMLYKLDYNRVTIRDYNFWERLRDSVVKPRMLQLRPSPVAIRELNTSECHRLKAIEPKVEDTQIKSLSYTGTETFKYKMDQLEVKEDKRSCSSTSLDECYKISCSTLSLPEKNKTSSKSPSSFIKKLFKTKKKSKKIALNS